MKTIGGYYYLGGQPMAMWMVWSVDIVLDMYGAIWMVIGQVGCGSRDGQCGQG